MQVEPDHLGRPPPGARHSAETDPTVAAKVTESVDLVVASPAATEPPIPMTADADRLPSLDDEKPTRLLQPAPYRVVLKPAVIIETDVVRICDRSCHQRDHH